MSLPIVSRTLSYVLTIVGAFALPLFTLLLGTVTERIQGFITAEFSDVNPPDIIGRLRAAAILSIGLLPVIPLLVAMFSMRRLFSNYANGDILTFGSAWLIRRTGLALAATAIFDVIAHPLQTFVLTASNAPGERAIAIEIGSGEFGFLITGALLVVIGWAMTDAARAAEENRGFV